MMKAVQLFLAVVASSLLAFIHADKDANPYPWGTNPNIKNKMYWRDANNVLEDLHLFSYLYIKVHGCAWSEYGIGMNYDDDGENHDGDENWYTSRVQTFRGNAAFSLYGSLRSDGSFAGGGCKKGTYINSFFTYLGADSIVKLLGLGISAFPDASYGSHYCYEYDDDESGRDRDLKSGSGDNREDSMSTTMGCASDNTFANAKFLGDDCDGNYFLNITDDLSSYNAAMRKVSCQQVWSYSKQYKGSRNLGQNFNDDQFNVTYGSVIEKLLLTSYACDLRLYPYACPDPYGLKSKYTNNMDASAGRKVSSRFYSNQSQGGWQTPMLFTSWILLILGLSIGAYVYERKNRRYIEQEGGGAQGFAKLAWGDLKTAVIKRTATALGDKERATSRKKERPKRKKSRTTSKSGAQIRQKKEAEALDDDDCDDINDINDKYCSAESSFVPPTLQDTEGQGIQKTASDAEVEGTPESMQDTEGRGIQKKPSGFLKSFRKQWKTSDSSSIFEANDQYEPAKDDAGIV